MINTKEMLDKALKMDETAHNRDVPKLVDMVKELCAEIDSLRDDLETVRSTLKFRHMTAIARLKRIMKLELQNKIYRDGLSSTIWPGDSFSLVNAHNKSVLEQAAEVDEV